MEKIKFGSGNSDHERLVNFVDSLERFMEQLIKEASGKGYFIPGFDDDYSSAWSELKPSFSALLHATVKANPDALQLHGLYGSQLNFKLNVINHFADSFFELSSGGWGSTDKVRKLLKKLLEAIDKFLASLIDAVGAGGAVAEYKDFLESIIEDGE
jgi:hypothetical protein